MPNDVPSHATRTFALLAMAAAAAPAFAGNNGVPTPTKVVVVIDENRSYSDIIGNQADVNATPAPYINTLARAGANFTNATEVIASPSQPNYIAFFSGAAQGVTSNSRFNWVYDPANHPSQPTNLIAAPSLGGQLIAAGKSFAGYSQTLPNDGSDVDASGKYMRKHNPFTQFADLAPVIGGVPNNSAYNKVFNATNFPTNVTNYSFLPTVSFVVPDQQNDMHDGTVLEGDNWLKGNLKNYADWAMANNSLLIVTFDEGNTDNGDTKVPTVMYGPMIQPGNYNQPITNYNLLRSIEDMYGLSYLGGAGSAASLNGVFVPEPTGAAIFGLGAAAGLIRRRRAAAVG